MWTRPPRALTLGPDEAHVWRIPLDDLDANAFLAGLSPEEAARNFLRPGLKERFVCAHGALRRILARYAGLAPAAIRYRLGPKGKPHLECGPRLEFNLSHSGGLALAAVACSREVGVDVECVRPIPELLDIARRMFPRSDAEALVALAPPEREAAFFRCWTRLEARLKATGGGLDDRLTLDGFAVVDLDPGLGYAAALALPGAPAAMSTWDYEP
jgi:4'-phosphopantetheinyl transferase